MASLIITLFIASTFYIKVYKMLWVSLRQIVKLIVPFTSQRCSLCLKKRCFTVKLSLMSVTRGILIFKLCKSARGVVLFLRPRTSLAHWLPPDTFVQKKNKTKLIAVVIKDKFKGKTIRKLCPTSEVWTPSKLSLALCKCPVSRQRLDMRAVTGSKNILKQGLLMARNFTFKSFWWAF